MKLIIKNRNVNVVKILHFQQYLGKLFGMLMKYVIIRVKNSYHRNLILNYFSDIFTLYSLNMCDIDI